MTGSKEAKEGFLNTYISANGPLTEEEMKDVSGLLRKIGLVVCLLFFDGFYNIDDILRECTTRTDPKDVEYMLREYSQDYFKFRETQI